MPDLIESDYVYFGFGKITEHLIKQNISQGKSVACITSQTQGHLSNQSLVFIDHASLLKYNVISRTAIFSWRELNHANKALLHWIFSNSFLAKKSFLLSSASVYRESNVPLDEGTNNLVADHLANKKFILERALFETLKSKDINHTNLRISNVYGENLDYGFVSSLINSIKYKIIPDIYTDTDIMRDYLSVRDLSSAIEELAKINIQEENLNVSTGVGTTLIDVLKVFTKFGFELNSANYVDAPKNLRKKVILDCSKLKSIIDWKPANFEVELKKILQTF
jgi:nucleoside-diphosphate-sugar epimerase